MRWIGATLLLAGCVTGGEVSQARTDHLNCLDRQIGEMRAAKSMFETGAQTRATAAECWRVFQSQVQAGEDADATALACRQLDGYAQQFHDRTTYHETRVAETAASCRELGANAERLATMRDRQRAAESAAMAYGDVARAAPAQAVGCSRDFGCPDGWTCVRPDLGDWGTCVRPVDRLSVP
jgi:hypothetical protein